MCPIDQEKLSRADCEMVDTSECSSETRGGVYCDQVIAGLLGEMSEDRKFFIRKVCQFYCRPTNIVCM